MISTAARCIRILRGIIIVVGLAALVAACMVGSPTQPSASAPKPSPTAQPLPCGGNPASSVELGYPYVGTSTAEFTTSGDPLFVTARYFSHGLLVPEGQGLAGIHVGSSATPPTWDRQRSIISNTIETVYVKEGEYGTLTLPAGRYWLWSSSGGDIVVFSCTPDGVSDPRPRR